MSTTPPPIDIDVIVNILKNSSRCAHWFVKGNTTTFILKDGDNPIAQKLLCLRKIDGKVVFNFAYNAANRMGNIDELLSWLKENSQHTHG